MSTHDEQLLEEHVELARKVDKLTKFLESPEFHELGGYDRMLLEFQIGHMERYLNVLDRRVERL